MHLFTLIFIIPTYYKVCINIHALFGDSISSPHSSAPGFDTSLSLILIPQVDTDDYPAYSVSCFIVVVSRLSITTQHTWPTYDFSIHNYAVWASFFELFLESRDLHHHLMTTLCHFMTRLMPLGSNSTQPLSLVWISTSSRGLSSLSCASCRRSLFGKPSRQCMPIR